MRLEFTVRNFVLSVECRNVSKQKEAEPLDPRRAALAERFAEWREERKRSDERLDELHRQFEIAHRRLRELARRV